MRDAAKARFDAAENGFDSGKCAFGKLSVDNRRHRRPVSGFAAGGVHVVFAETAADSVDADHGVHVSGRDSDCDIGAPHDFERLGILPVRLGDHADAEPFIEQVTPDYGGSERRVFHIGVTCQKQNVDGIPAESFHLAAGHRQKFYIFVHKRSILAV